VQVKLTDTDRPVRHVTDEGLDFAHSAPFQKSYFVASSYRCGSSYFCWKLWQTGLLGAPMEALSPTRGLRILMNRFNASSPADYVVKLLAHRTSGNGVFGMKGHFHHFEAFRKEYPALLEVLSPMTFIYISRQDKIAQAVSMAKALQTGQWTSRMGAGPGANLQYDYAMIANCLNDIEQQDVNWRRWFEANGVLPFQVTYEDLTADPEGVVRGVVELLGVENDEPDVVDVPAVNKQGDETNAEWIERFEGESKAGGDNWQTEAAGVERDAPAVDAGSEKPAAEGDFFDRHDQMIKSLSAKSKTATDFINMIRLRRRYCAIIAQNRPLFQGARVLDLVSAKGFWSFAALESGAAYVAAVERSRKPVLAGVKAFADYGIKPESFRFIRSGLFAALESFDPEAFDVILCKGSFDQAHFPQLFEHLSRLRPKHVILDTMIASGQGPLARFTIAGSTRTRKGRKASKQRNPLKPDKGRISSTPSHDLIEFLCDPEFRCRSIDWQAMGIADWTGIQDYARDKRRTYVLDLVS
jgi:trehalose 2-sulfotransferase